MRGGLGSYSLFCFTTLVIVWSSPAYGQVTIPNRPFAVDVITLHLSPDGLFDISVGVHTIGVFLLNEGPTTITNVTATASFDIGSNITMLDATEEFGDLEPGVPVLGFFTSDFSGTDPDKHLLTLQLSGDAFSESLSRNVFVVRSEQDPVDDNKWTVFTPEGQITTEIIGTYGGDNFGSLSVPTSLKWTVEYAVPFSGQFSDLPYGDPFWKAMAAGVRAVAGNRNIVIAILAACPNGWAQTILNVAAFARNTGTVLVALDSADPFRRGQTNTIPGVGEITIREIVTLDATFPTEPLVGTSYTADVSWLYTRVTDVTTYNHQVSETVSGDHNTTSRTVTVNATEFLPAEQLVVTAEATGPVPLTSDNSYFVANIFGHDDMFRENPLSSLVLRDEGRLGDLVAGDGIYTVRAPANSLPSGTLMDAFVFGFDMNNAAESDPPLVAAQEIGGLLVSPPGLESCGVTPDTTLIVQPEPIPALSQWGIVALVLCLVATAIFVRTRREGGGLV